MAFINIPRDRDDPNYRYKMPKLCCKVEGRGNGIKTNIMNMGEIAKALKRPPMYPTKFFGCELGAQSKYDEAEEKSLVNGAHTDQNLIEILDKFIQMYVLCPGCGLPEMDMYVKKGLLLSKCNACGNASELDMSHKAAGYMIKNPPNSNASTVVNISKKKSKEKRNEKNSRRQLDTEENEANVKGDPAGENNDVSKKRERRKKKDKNRKQRSPEGSEEDFDESAAQLPPTESVRGPSESSDDNPPKEIIHDSKEKKKKKDKKKEIEKTGDKVQFNERMTFDSPEVVEIVERMRSVVGSRTMMSPVDFFQELRVLQVSQDFDSTIRLYITLLTLFGKSINLKDFESKVELIKKVSDSSVTAVEFFAAFEHFVTTICDESSLANYPYLIQKIYSNRILDSASILNYYKRDSGNRSFLECKAAAEPVLQWLEDNDTEEETDED